MNALASPQQAAQIDRPGIQPLSQWMRTLVDYVRSGKPDLTNRQMALMLTVYIGDGPHTVRGLAEQLHVSKPVITRALDTMGEQGLVTRQRDERDKRNVVIKRTVDGALFLERLGDLIIATGRSQTS